MNMQKKVLSLCIALALGNNAFAAPEVEHKAKIEDKTCPAKGTVLTKEQKAKLPKKCLPAEEETTWEWIAGGAAAAVAGIVAIASGGSGGGGGSSHHSDPTPDPVPDPVPDPTPDPIPDPVPDPAHETVSYANGALLDKTAKTLQINGVTYSYSLDGDRYALTAPDGTVLYTNSANWSVDANNDLLIKGKDAAGLYWSYDAAGKFIHADANTKVVEGDGANTIIDTGSSASGQGSAGTIVDGDGTTTEISGGTSAKDGGTGTKVDGNDAVVDNKGDTTASGEGSTGTDITGDGGKVINGGDSAITDGGTGTKIDGKDAQVDNKGDATISGEGSTGTDIKGDDAVINNDGKTDITDGGTGTKIDGNGADVINTGDTSASGSGSTVTDITGDGAAVDNTGKKDITDGGTGTKIDGKDAQVDNKGDSTISGGGSTGTEIKGDDATINNNGKTDVTEGGTGTKIDGNGADVINTGDTSASGSGSTGTVITGDGAVVDNTGKTDVAEGGTGTKVDGNDAKIDNKGDSTSKGADSVVIDVTGDSAVINNTGNTEVTDGGTGTKIDGKDAKVDNQGDTTATGTGSAGTVITGDNAQVNNQGDTTVADGATGTKIDGNNAAVTIKGDGTEPTKIDVTGGGKGVVINGNDANIAIEDATANVDGTGSALATITGDNATATIAGDIYVKNAAHGVDVAGDNSTVTTAAKIFVQDLNSVGINISALNDGTDEKTTFTNTGDINVTNNATGVIISGDKADVTLDGNVNITSIKDTTDGLIHNGGTGVSVVGNNGNIKIKGNILVKSEGQVGDLEKNDINARGLFVSGSDNDIIVDGTVSVNDIAIATANAGAGSAVPVFEGINITGSGNSVSVKNGLNADLKDDYTSYDDSHDVSVVSIDGPNNNFSLSGHSEISGAYDRAIASVLNGGTLILNKDSTINFRVNKSSTYGTEAILKGTGENSYIENNGDINLLDGLLETRLIGVEAGATALNTGHITAAPANAGGYGAGRIMSAENGAMARNSGQIDLISNLTNANQPASVLYSSNDGNVINTSSGTINSSGPYSFGIEATSNGKAENQGTINFDGFYTVVDESNNPTGTKTPYTVADSSAYRRGAAVEANGTGANALNSGSINVNNSGFGMLARSGGTVTNQGNITLTAVVTTVSDGTQAQLVGMGAISGGTAINDTTGVININTDLGKAFYVDGSSSIIVNHGTVNYNGSPDDGSHMGSAPQTGAMLDGTFTHAGATNTLDNPQGYVALDNIANYGNTTLNSTLTTSKTLFNLEDATLTVAAGGVITGPGNIDNRGVLDATASNISLTTDVYNRAGATLRVDGLTKTSGTLFNDGTLQGSVNLNSVSGVNTGDWSVSNGKTAVTVNSGRLFNKQGGTIHNTGAGTGPLIMAYASSAKNDTEFANDGTVLADQGYSAVEFSYNGYSSQRRGYNTSNGNITGNMTGTNKSVVKLGNQWAFYNQGSITVKGDNAIGINAAGSKSTVVNAGTINVGTAEGKTDGTNGSGLTGISSSNAGNIINNTATGVINLYANNSYAFGGTGTFINNGTVNASGCDTGCAIFASGTTGTTGTDTAIPEAMSAPGEPAAGTPPPDQVQRTLLSGYRVGTNTDGSAGQFSGNNVDVSQVTIDTGFTAGSAAKTETFDDVFKGSNLAGAENIQADSVVWSAEGKTDASGNVDVTMTKKAYTDVVTDSGVNSVAGALEAGYTNNALYQSLNLKTAKDVTNAMKQLSGSKATSAFNDAKVQSNRFTMLADSAIETSSGLGFNVVAKGDKRAELGNNTQYDMMALSQKLSLTDSQTLKLQYGIARLDGNGDVKSAGDNGLTGGYSQFFGLEHHMDLGDEMSWDNALRYDNHQLDSSRFIQYGSVNEVADSKNTQQYMELKSQFSKGFALSDTLNFKPSVGAKVRHTRDGSVNETGANDYNLKMDAGSETAVDAIAGMELTYAGKNGWAATASVEGGPNLSYSKSTRSASLQGAAGQRFNVDDGQKGGGVNSLAQVGVSYNQGNASLSMDAYNWQEDSVSDKGMTMNFKLSFK